MDKYVKADKVKEKCAESCKYVRVGDEEYLSVGDVCRIVDEIQAEDVKKNKHGKWERKPDPYEFFDDIPVCSECGCTTKYREETPFCPNCGADMRGELDE